MWQFAVPPAPPSEHALPWYRLDNTAKIFPPTVSAEYSTVFRLSVTLRDPINLPRAAAALEASLERYPYFRTRLRRGWFWYYIEHDPRPPRIEPDNGVPCYPPPELARKPTLMRMRVRGTRLAFEFSHILTDGVGALTLVRAVVERYLAAGTGVTAAAGNATAAGDATAAAERAAETEDAYLRDYAKHLPMPVEYPPAWHVGGARVAGGLYHCTALLYDAQAVHAAARERGASITEFLLGAFLYALQVHFRSLPRPEQYRRRNRRPLRVLVPVNLRPMTGTVTLRNYFVYVMVELDQRVGWYDLDEVIGKVHHTLRAETDVRSLRRQLKRNVRAELNPWIRALPIVLKDVILRAVHRAQGEAANTASFSSLGRVDWPDSVAAAIEHMEFYPPPSHRTGVNATVVTTAGQLTVGFGSTLNEKSVERIFVRVLSSLGLHARLVHNWGRDR